MTEKFQTFETAFSTYCFKHNAKSRRWIGIPRAQVLEVYSPANFLIYVKDSALPKGWWGIAFTVYHKLFGSRSDWHLVLLVRNGEEGYLLTATRVNGMVSALSRNATEYIFHESDAEAGAYFRTFEELFERLLK